MVGSVGGSSPVWGNQMQPTAFNPTKPAAQQSKPDQSSQTDGVQVRITPTNFRDVLGPQSDVLLTPQNMKDLYEKGYLDVKKSRTVMESNEGTFTILAKAFAAFVAPSRSLGAITIDPNFMEMIKDPNAKIGFGYTRVENQTIEVLSRPDSPPPPNKAVPPYLPPIRPQTPGDGQPTLTEVSPKDPPTTPAPPVNVDPKKPPVAPQTNQIYVVQTGNGKGHSDFERVNDSTWSGAHIEAALQDRDLAESHQRIQRLSIDLNSIVSRQKEGKDTVKLESQIRGYLKNSGLSQGDIESMISDAKSGKVKMSSLDNAARVVSKGQFPDFASSSAVERHAQDFRAIGYVSPLNATESAHEIGKMGTGTANSILNREITGKHSDKDGITHFYDTERVLSSRSILPTTDKKGNVDPGYPVYANDPKYAGAKTLYDVYKIQTETTPVPDNALGDYAKLYNAKFSPKPPVTEESLKAMPSPPTLKDMYALRASNFGNPPVAVTAKDGHVGVSNDAATTRTINNVRLVLEANAPGVATHVFDAQAVEAVNGRAAYNFRNTPLDLHDNTGARQVTGASKDERIQQTIHRMQLLPSEDLDAVDTQKFNSAHQYEKLDRVGYGFQGTTTAGDTPTPQALQETIQSNITALNQPGVSPESRTNMQTAIQGQIAQLKSMGGDVTKLETDFTAAMETSAKPLPSGAPTSQALQDTIKANIASLNQIGVSPKSSENMQKAIGAQIAKLEGMGVDTTQLKADLAAAVKTAGTKPPPTKPSDESLKAAIASNMKDLTALAGEINAGKRVNPQSVSILAKAIEDDLARLPDGDDKKALDGQLKALMADPKVMEYKKAGTAMGLQGEAANIGQSLTDFHRYVKEVVADGKVDFTEKKGLEDFVARTARTMVTSLRDNGVEGFAGMSNQQIDAMLPVDMQVKLSKVTPEQLAKATKPAQGGGQPVKSFEGAELDHMVNNLDTIKSAQASINLASEGTYTASLYQNVKHLDQKLNEFDQVEVIKTAFRGEMKGLAAQSPPEKFNALMQTVYGLPPCPPNGDGPNKAVFDAYKGLQAQAAGGKLSMPPNVSFVDRAQLGGGNGAYAEPTGPGQSPTILLARDLINQPDKMMDVFTEEMGHHLEHSTEVQVLARESADNKISSMIGPLNNTREQVGQDTNIQAALAAGDTGKAQDLLAPTVQSKTNGWLQSEMAPLLAKGEPGRAEAETKLADKLVLCGMNADVAKTRAHEMLQAPAQGTTALTLAPVSLADAKTMSALLIDSSAKPPKLAADRGPAGTLGELKRSGARPAAIQKEELKLTGARNDLAAAQGGKHVDAQGDEGRAFLFALRAIRGGRSTEVMQSEATRGRGEELQINQSGQIKKAEDEFDQGIAAKDIVDEGRTVLAAGTRMEFSTGETSSGPPPGEAETLPPVQASSAAQPVAGPNPYQSQTRSMEPLNPSSFPGPSQISDNFAPVDPSKAPAQAAYDEKPGKFASIAKTMMDVVPQGMKSFGQTLVQTAENWQREIKQLFASMMKPVTIAEETIYGGGGPWDHDVEVGRKGQNYEAGQTNLRFKESTPTGGAPDYHRNSREANERQQAARAQQQRGQGTPGAQSTRATATATTTPPVRPPRT